ILRQVDADDLGQFCSAIAAGQLDLLIAAQLHLMARLNGWRGGGENDRAFLEEAAHHRYVAGMVAYALLLLEAGLMRLVDDDEAEIGEGHEQRRARTDDNLRLPACDGSPGAPPLGLAQ